MSGVIVIVVIMLITERLMMCWHVRMEYDAFRIDVESKQCSPETQQIFQQHKLKFEQLRQVLDIKLQLLDENRVQTVHHIILVASSSLHLI